MAEPSGVPGTVFDEVVGAVPLLIERTRAQLELVGLLIGRLPCLSHRAAPATTTAPATDTAPPTETAPPPESEPSVVATADRTASASSSASAAGPDPVDAPTADQLAIPDYDSLAASQVVPRLASLDADELADVGSYERAHRARQTILNRVRQLQDTEES